MCPKEQCALIDRKPGSSQVRRLTFPQHSRVQGSCQLAPVLGLTLKDPESCREPLCHILPLTQQREGNRKSQRYSSANIF